MILLDKTRSFGRIGGHFENGDPMQGAEFEQDGFLFRIDGSIVEGAMTDADKARLEQIVRRNDAMDAARAAFRTINPDIDPETLAKIINADALTNPESDDAEIDLIAWANGTKAFNYAKVAKEFRERFSQSPVNRQQGLEILAAHGLIPPLGRSPTIPSES